MDTSPYGRAAPTVDGMSDVVICEPVRTPVGRFGGALSSLSAVDLASLTLTELVRRTGLGEGDVDDVVLGQGYTNGESPAIGRPSSKPRQARAQDCRLQLVEPAVEAGALVAITVALPAVA